MRRFFVGLYFILFQISGNAQSKIDVLHYKFNLELNDKNDTIYGIAEITVKFLDPALGVEFDFNSESKGMYISKITGVKLSFQERQNNKLKIGFDNVVKSNDTIIFTIYYNGIPNDGLIISKNKYGHRTFFADNWPNRAHNWIPCVDDPGDKASVEFIITAPSHYEVISNGVQVEEKNLPDNKKLTHWKEAVPLPTKIMVIGVADFAVKEFADSPPGIPVSAWVYPEDSSKGFKNYSVAPAILKFLSDYIGPYPYEKLANVQSKTIFGGMENASAIFYDEGSASSSRTVESLLAHEITHQWFGDMATEKSFAHLWLSEGFATYLTHIYIESKYGTDSLNVEMKKDRAGVIDFVKMARKPVVDSNSDYMELLNANSYQKGSWVLHMLRRQLGDSVFKKSICQYYTEYAGKNANTDDLRKVFEAVSRKDLNKFFTQWLYTPENPNLKISWKYDAKKQLILLTVVQLQDRLFEFPLDIAVQSATTRIGHLAINKKTEIFKIPVKKKPLNVIPDPFTSVLFEAKITEVK